MLMKPFKLIQMVITRWGMRVDKNTCFADVFCGDEGMAMTVFLGGSTKA